MTAAEPASAPPVSPTAPAPQPIRPAAAPLYADGSLRLDADSNGMSMTPDEFDAIEDYEAGFRYELLWGLVIVSPSPSEPHDDQVDHLGYLLRKYREEHPQGKVLDKTLVNRYVRTAAGRRQPDRVIWAGLGRRPDSQADVPTITIEIVSQSNRDRRRDYLEKRDEYRAAGVREYWIVDRFRRRLTVCFLDGTERIVAESETYATPLLPGFELPLAPLLAQADDWDASPSDASAPGDESGR